MDQQQHLPIVLNSMQMPQILQGAGSTYSILQTTVSDRSCHKSTLVEGTTEGKTLGNSQLCLGQEGSTSLTMTLKILN